LLESKPQVGTRVRIPTEQFVRDRFVVREALECQSARLFAERATLEQKHELRLMAEQMDTLFSRLAAGNGDADFTFAVHGYHFQLHMRIAEYSGCVELQRALLFCFVAVAAAGQSAPARGPVANTQIEPALLYG